jgi:hypothetical protein
MLVDEILHGVSPVNLYFRVGNLGEIGIAEFLSHHRLHGLRHEKPENIFESFASSDFLSKQVEFRVDPLVPILRVGVAHEEIQELIFIGLQSLLTEKHWPFSIKDSQIFHIAVHLAVSLDGVDMHPVGRVRLIAHSAHNVAGCVINGTGGDQVIVGRFKNGLEDCEVSFLIDVPHSVIDEVCCAEGFALALEGGFSQCFSGNVESDVRVFREYAGGWI